MKKEYKLILLYFFILVAIILICCSCTKNTRARVWGGNITIDLPKGQKLTEATWKGDGNSLWYLTEPMDSDYIPKTKIFREDSRFGLFEGSVTFVEKK